MNRRLEAKAKNLGLTVGVVELKKKVNIYDIKLEVNLETKFQKMVNKLTYTINSKLIPDFYTKFFVRFIRGYFQYKPVVGAEIGVCHGDTACDMIKKLNIKKIYLIDAFKMYNDYDCWVPGNTQEWYDNEYIKLKNRMAIYGDKVEIIKKFSNEAYKMFPDEFFDFIYIDTLHDYTYIMEDLKNWYPKIKVDGVFGGHGFDSMYSLCEGLIEFCREKKIEHQGLRDDWWIIKK
jgi:hypothetical protein